jgi:DNA-binding GntR family transcriptional regulator
VTEISRQDLDDIFPLMAMLEGRCAADAVKRAKPPTSRTQDHSRATRIAARDGRIDAFFEANQEFHAASRNWPAIAGCCRSSRICARCSSFPACTRCRWKGACSSRWMSIAASWQRFQAGDAVKAEKLMHDHLLSGREALAKMDAKGTPWVLPSGTVNAPKTANF